MRNTRIHVSHPPLPRGASGARVRLAGPSAHHLSRVLRARIGDEVILFDGQGGEFDATVDGISHREVTVVLSRFRDVARESPVAVTLALGLSRGDRMDLAIQKAVELGVAAIVPLATGRAVAKLAGERTARRLEHWRRIAIGACEQSGRTALPRIADPVALGAWLADPGPAGEVKLCLDPRARPGPPLAPARPAVVAIAVGPEGGFTDGEREALSSAGFAGLGLGPRTLRTETAAMTAVLLAQLWWGDLGGSDGRSA